nr:Chain C, 8-mer peptide [Human immunodeficiency virus 1]
KRWIILGL